MFITGYTKELANYVAEKGRYFARCESCRYYDDTDTCSNNQVTRFDIVNMDGRYFCMFWQPEKGE